LERAKNRRQKTTELEDSNLEFEPAVGPPTKNSQKKTPAPHIHPSNEEATDLSTVNRTPPNTTLLGTSEHTKTRRQPRGATAKETPWETAEEQKKI
jgi:hypothetical protein